MSSSLSQNINDLGSNIAYAHFKVIFIIGLFLACILAPYTFKKDKQTAYTKANITNTSCEPLHTYYKLFYSCNFKYNFYIDGKTYYGTGYKSDLMFPNLENNEIVIKYDPSNPLENSPKDDMSVKHIAKLSIMMILITVAITYIISYTIHNHKDLGGLYLLSYF
jgi:hypothetical protein